MAVPASHSPSLPLPDNAQASPTLPTAQRACVTEDADAGVFASPRRRRGSRLVGRVNALAQT